MRREPKNGDYVRYRYGHYDYVVKCTDIDKEEGVLIDIFKRDKGNTTFPEIGATTNWLWIDRKEFWTVLGPCYDTPLYKAINGIEE
jgi:hypothetical protein